MPDNKFQEEVHDVLQKIEDLLIAKNEKYGNSALEPLGVFSQLSAKEGLLVRIDDKLKRIKNGSLEKDDEDVVNDLVGYLVLLKIHAKQTTPSNISNPYNTNSTASCGYAHTTTWSHTTSKSHNED
jgi:hypothetical protein